MANAHLAILPDGLLFELSHFRAWWFVVTTKWYPSKYILIFWMPQWIARHPFLVVEYFCCLLTWHNKDRGYLFGIGVYAACADYLTKIS